MKNKLLFLLLLALVFSCSKDEENLEDLEAIEWNVEIGDITATSLTFSDYLLRGGQSSEFGYRKVGDDNFSQFKISTSGLTGLEPLTNYEIRIFEPGTTNFSSKVVSFTTLPFDVDYSSFNSDSINDTIASYEGFTHSMRVTNVSNAITSISATLKAKGAYDDLLLQNVKIEDEVVYFSIPDGSIPDEPYEYHRSYDLQYTLNGKSFIIGDGSKDETEKTFIVYNTKPYIGSVRVKLIENGGTFCNSMPIYNIQLEGAFMSHIEDPLSTSFIDDSSMRAIITNTSTNELLMYQIDDNTKCRLIGRGNSEDKDKDEEADVLLTYQYTNWIGMNDLKSEYGLHPGEYSIRVVFEKGDEFYETNEFPFTIEE